MGHDKHSAEQTIARLVEELSKDEAFSALSQSQREDQLFRKALVEMAR